jgi:5-methylcytosine-specific restriction endonuclease McrA
LNVSVWRGKRSVIRLSYTCGCGEVVETSYQHFKRGKRCRPCAFRQIRGPAHPNFNPSLTEEERLIKRQFALYADWRTAVFSRDGYTCQRCGRGRGIVAHHVENYHACRSKRLDLNNGVTLCRECHVGFHRVFGYKNNSLAQLVIWIVARACSSWN